MKVSVIIPVYNEFTTFHQVLERVHRATLPAGCTKEIVVVDDGSTDGTRQALDEKERAGIVVGHHNAKNAGKGTAIRAGIELASGDIVLIQDGDLEYDPDDYVAILEPIVSGEADVVYGSRFLGAAVKTSSPDEKSQAKTPAPHGKTPAPHGMAWKNRLANRILTFAANLLYGARITDEATAYKAFRTPLLRQIRLECRRFEFCPEVTAKLRRLGFRIHEVPIRYNARGISEGKKIRAQDGVEALWTLLRYRFQRRSKFVSHTIEASIRDASQARE